MTLRRCRAWAAAVLLIGAAIPDMWLRRAILRRQEEIQFALPDAMDLSVIAVEAGDGDELGAAQRRGGQTQAFPK